MPRKKSTINQIKTSVKMLEQSLKKVEASLKTLSWQIFSMQQIEPQTKSRAKSIDVVKSVIKPKIVPRKKRVVAHTHNYVDVLHSR